MTPILSLVVRYEEDVVAARQRARQIAAALGFDPGDQTRIATAVSEIARNAFIYAKGGRVAYELETEATPARLVIRVTDSGPGIARLDEILSGRYQSPTGLGLGIIGTRRLMDSLDVQTSPSGTAVVLARALPAGSDPWRGPRISALSANLAAQRTEGPFGELREQNQELVRALDELSQRQEELQRVNRELEDTNRGVVALYAELDERADHLRRSDELKTRFLSNMTHEFRTPVNSIRALTELLAERLGLGREKDELFFIRKSAAQLAEMVDDLLDLAKASAGKIDVRPALFEVRDLFGALRGILAPLLVNRSLSLVFDDPIDVPPIYSDEGQLSQILRNFISNALKYTEKGEVRVSARVLDNGTDVEFSVADTGIGIPEEHLSRVFEEFVQIENPLQRSAKGTGLGLPLSKRLAELLGGYITVQSTLGLGSVFAVVVPLKYLDAGVPAFVLDIRRRHVFVIQSDPAELARIDRGLALAGYQAVPLLATGGRRPTGSRPAALVVDVGLPGREGWNWLARARRDEDTASLPLIAIATDDEAPKAIALGADACAPGPVSLRWLVSTLDNLTAPTSPVRVLAIDDEETAHFIVQEMLQGPEYLLVEANGGEEGLRLARAGGVDVVLLDLHMPGLSGFEVHQALREDPATAGLPIVVVTSTALSDVDRFRLGSSTQLLSKAALTRDALRGAIRRACRASDRVSDQETH